MKQLLATVAIAVTFAMFVPYIRSIRQGRTRPHAFSWIIWALVTFVVFLAQLAGHGGAGAWPIGVSGLITIYIALLAWRAVGDRHITLMDWVFLMVALSALPVWALTADPLSAVILLTCVDLAGFGPTFRSAYLNPHHEPVAFYLLGTLRNGLAIAALQHYSLTTVLFPAAVAASNLVFVAMAVWRRQQQGDRALADDA